MDARLAEIRQKLNRLRAHFDRGRCIFGAREYREFPVLDAEGVRCLEAECGVPLPTELRAFLEQVHGGGIGPGYGFDVWGEPDCARRPFPHGFADFERLMQERSTDPHASLPMSDEDRYEFWPPGDGFLPVAHLGCGVFDVLVVSGELAGTVWCCDMAWRPHTHNGRLASFLDWYEDWLERNLVRLER